jgi:HEAT repeat protein
VFNVVPPERRDQTRAFIDGVPGQAGTMIAGLILIVGEQALQPQQLYFIGLGAAALATFVAWQALRAYSGALMAALRAGQPHVFFTEEEPFGGFQRDATAVAAAVAGLSDPDPVIRRVSAEIVGNLSTPQAAPALMNTLADENAEVRVASLRALAHARAAPALLDVAACLSDSEPEVRAKAVETLCQLAGGTRGLIVHLQPRLDDPAPTVRARAAVALLKIAPNAPAQALLIEMTMQGETEARVAALTALGEWGDASTFDLIAAQLSESVPAIRRAAIPALAQVGAERARDFLIHALGDDDTSVREAAAAALGGMGGSALETTVSALSNPALETGALLALEQLPARQAAPKIRAYAGQRVDQALYYDELARGIEVQLAGEQGNDDRFSLLILSLRDKAHYHALNALRAIGLVGERAALSLAVENLKSHDPAQRANALETIESVGEREIARPLLRLWEASDSAPAAPDGLLHVLQDSDNWLRACAVLVAGHVTESPIRSMLVQLARSDEDDMVREAADSALKGSLDMNTLATLSLMERIIFLRRVPLFFELTPVDLKQVGAIATERTYPDGMVIAQQGEPGDEMYVIVSGEIRVLTGANMELARRKTGEYVGEMAIISQEPRMASLVAAGDVRLLCIDQKHFEGLLRERPETSLAVMRVLCARLRQAHAARLPQMLKEEA